MKICFLAGADSIHSKVWIEYLAGKGYEIHWISLTQNIFSDIKNVKLYVLKKFSGKISDIVFNAYSVRKLVKQINPDILHVHYYSWHYFGNGKK
ncbi:MAG: glycosyltransferase [Candidatus Nealsonbacteria bacterium]